MIECSIYQLIACMIIVAYNNLFKRGSNIMQIWFVISLLLSLIVAVFAVLNSDIVTIRFFSVNYQLSESLVILIAAALGAIITIFLGLFSKLKTSLRTMELNNEIKNSRLRIDELNNTIKNSEQKNSELNNQLNKSKASNDVTLPM
jgi:lipopolysaccharide assembly protein A